MTSHFCDFINHDFGLFFSLDRMTLDYLTSANKSAFSAVLASFQIKYFQILILIKHRKNMYDVIEKKEDFFTIQIDFRKFINILLKCV